MAQIAEPAKAIGEQGKGNRPGQREPELGRQPTRQSRRKQAKADPDLAACRAGQKLAQGHEIGVTALG